MIRMTSGILNQFLNHPILFRLETMTSKSTSPKRLKISELNHSTFQKDFGGATSISRMTKNAQRSTISWLKTMSKMTIICLGSITPSNSFSGHLLHLVTTKIGSSGSEVVRRIGSTASSLVCQFTWALMASQWRWQRLTSFVSTSHWELKDWRQCWFVRLREE